MATVVVPVWDAYCAVAGEAVASALAQEAPAAVLVVDNASAVPLPVLPAGVRVVRLGRRATVGAARNAGLARVRTELVLFLDADDVMLPGTLGRLAAAMRARPGRTACVCGIVAWNAATGARRPLSFPSPATRALLRWPAAYGLHAALANRVPTTGCLLMRTADALAAGGFADADFAEDWALNLGLAFRGPIGFVPHAGRLHRVHAGSLRERAIPPAEVERGFRLVAERIRTDPAAPALVRGLRPLVARRHARDLRRLTRGGAPPPGRAVRAVGDGGLRPAARAGP